MEAVAGPKARPWVRTLARAGYAAHGVLYLTIAALAVLVASGNGERQLDGKGALHELHAQPFGKALLVVMAIGLVGFALWRFVQAAVDPEHQAHGAKGIAKRIGWAIGGVIHGALVVYAIGLLSGTMLGGDSSGDKARSWSARVLSWDPYGAWIVAGVGVTLLGIATWQLVRAWKTKLDERLDLSRLRAPTRRLVVNVSRVGIAARGIVAGLVGAGLVTAALRYNPGHVHDVAEALDRVRGLPFGNLVLGAVALGLGAYGVYALLEAGFRRIGGTAQPRARWA